LRHAEEPASFVPSLAHQILRFDFGYWIGSLARLRDFDLNPAFGGFKYRAHYGESVDAQFGACAMRPAFGNGTSHVSKT
jgi:hypothetical protein